MFAQLGDIVFEPLNGFDSYSDQEEAMIAVYPLLGTKPLPVPTATGLKEINVGIRLHQRFVNVSQMRTLITGYLQHGDALALSWGSGEVEGSFYIRNVSTDLVETDTIGNAYCVHLTLSLLEVPDGVLFDNKIKIEQKKAFATNKTSVPVVFKVPVPRKVRPWEEWVHYVGKAIEMAGMIEALSYGGRFPYLGRTLGQIMGNLDANLGIMQDLWGGYGSDFDIDDVSSELGDARTSIGLLQGFAGAFTWVAFGIENKNLQRLMVFICY